MIPLSYIRAWSNRVPWINDEQVEQDLVISRSLVEIFSNERLKRNLAFRGGTALHKLYLNPLPRYSEDIDLVQKVPGPIRVIIDNLRDVLAFIGEPSVTQKKRNNTLIYRFDSENTTPVTLKLKIEINCREHFTVLGFKEMKLDVESEWYRGSAFVETFELEEILGTKLRALYQRKKGRDLYDLYKAFILKSPEPEKVLKCYHEYMMHVVKKGPTGRQFIKNLEEKLKDSEFLGDINYLLLPEEKYDHHAAYELIRTELIERM